MRRDGVIKTERAGIAGEKVRVVDRSPALGSLPRIVKGTAMVLGDGAKVIHSVVERVVAAIVIAYGKNAITIDCDRRLELVSTHSCEIGRGRAYHLRASPRSSTIGGLDENDVAEVVGSCEYIELRVVAAVLPGDIDGAVRAGRTARCGGSAASSKFVDDFCCCLWLDCVSDGGNALAPKRSAERTP